MIFVTGGTGLVGRAVLRELRTQRLPAIALVRDPSNAALVEALGARAAFGRVEDSDSWQRMEGVSAIVHAAALLRSPGGWPALARVNVEGARLAARCARTLGVPLVHLSSVAVYGDVSHADDGSVGEGWPERPLAPHNLYARSKREAEGAVRAEMASGLRAILLRPCPVYGEGDRLFLPRIVAAARRGWMPLIGAGDRPIPLVHATSVAGAVAAAIRSSAAWGRACNVTADGTITAAEVLAAAGRGAGRRIRTFRLPERGTLSAATLADALLALLPAGRLPGTLRTGIGYWRGGNPFDAAAARSALGWAPEVRHAEEIEREVRRALQGPDERRPRT